MRKNIIADTDRDIRLNLDTMEEIPLIIKDTSYKSSLIGWTITSDDSEVKQNEEMILSDTVEIVVDHAETVGVEDLTVYPPEMRYLCPRCTNIAYICEGVLTNHPVAICESCRETLPNEVDPTRFLPL